MTIETKQQVFEQYIDKVLQIARKRDYALYLLFLLMKATGARHSDAKNFSNWVKDEENNEIFYFQIKTKAKRTLKITDIPTEIIEATPQQIDYMQSYSKGKLNHFFRSVIQEPPPFMESKYLITHIFRHHAILEKYTQGKTPQEIASWIGVEVSTVQSYLLAQIA